MTTSCFGPADTRHEMAAAIRHNTPIEPRLHVVAVLTNACLYKRRYQLFDEFVARLDANPDVILYIVELAYGNQAWHTKGSCAYTGGTDLGADRARCLRLRTEHPMWHKENLINLAVEQLLPSDWKAVCWVDADLEFDSPSWATDTLKILNGCRDIVQPFSHAIDLDPSGLTLSVASSCGYQYERHKKYNANAVNIEGVNVETAWTGYAWAMNRTAWDQLSNHGDGGLYEDNILGSGDNILAKSLLNLAYLAFKQHPPVTFTEEYKQSIREYQHFCLNPHKKFGYIPGVIYHHYHGPKSERGYGTRALLFEKWAYCPDMVERNSDGVLVPTAKCPAGFLADIAAYFVSRKEGERFEDNTDEKIAAKV